MKELKPFINAISGIIHCFKSEKNFRFHSMFSVFVIILSFILKINLIEWLFIFTAIFLVLAAEVINTSLEKTLDIIDKNHNEKIKLVKDMSAGFVLILSIYAIIVGIIVFLPKLFYILGIR